MMIEGLDVEYYQSHLNTSVDFHPGTTAITGISMEGKTALLRAFDQLRTNRPLGIRRKYRYDDEPMKIVLRVDGHRVGWTKNDKPIDDEGNKSMYWIDYPNGTRKEFKTIGNGPPPPEVVDLIRVSDIAVQKQLDAYLLVTSTSGEIARTINKITGLDEGEDWVKQLTKGIGEINREDKLLSTQLEIEKANLARYEGVDEFRRKILEAKSQQIRYDQGLRQMTEIMDSINFIEGATVQEARARRIRSDLGELLERWKGLEERAEKLNNDLDEITRAWYAQKSLKASEERRAMLMPFLDRVEEVNNYIEWCRGVIAVRSDYYTKKDLVIVAEQQLEGTKDQYALELAKLGKCFVCASDISDPVKIRRNL